MTQDATGKLMEALGSDQPQDWGPVDEALAEGADVDARHEDGWTATMLAAMKSADLTRRLALAGAELDARSGLVYGGVTALMVAAQIKKVDVVEVLVEFGADLEISDDMGWTVASWAALNGDAPMLRRLIELGADIGAIDSAGRSLAMLAAANGQGDCVQALIEAGADLDGLDREGKTAWEVATGSARAPILAQMERRLLESSAGAPVNQGGQDAGPDRWL